MSKPLIFINRPDITPSALAILQDKYDLDIWSHEEDVPRDVLLDRVRGTHGLLLSSKCRIDEELVDAAGDQLKVIATMSVGYDHIDVDKVKARGVHLGYTPGVLDDAMAELTVALLLTRTRRLWEGHQAIVEGRWPGWVPWTWLNGAGLKDSVVGIIGLGRIGLEVARRLVPFKVKRILYTSRSDKHAARDVGAERTTLQELLTHSDMVVVTCSLNKETHHLLGTNEFQQMKPTAYIVNTSRGQVIDQQALITALKSGVIAGAALDVMEPEPLPPQHELLKLPNCYVIPHMGSAVVATRVAMAELTARNIVAGIEGTPLPAEIP